VATLALSLKLFSGPGVRGTRTGQLGPWLVTLAVVAVCGAAISTKRFWARVPRALGGVGLALVATGLFLLESDIPDWYLYIHILLLCAAVVALSGAVLLFPLPRKQLKLLLLLSPLLLPPLLMFPDSPHARALLVSEGWAGVRLIEYAQLKVDFDHDGYSPLFGGGDCDDRNPYVFAGAPEYAGDGRDSNCDGHDDPLPRTLSFEPFHVQASDRVHAILERARHYPTVVILVDALRFDRIGNPRFPNLSRLAQESIAFTRAYATSSTTLTSVPSMVTGVVRPDNNRQTIAQVVAAEGQRAAFVSVDLIGTHFQAGGGRLLNGYSSSEFISTGGKGWILGESEATSEAISARAVKLLDAETPPDLLWLHYFDVHQWRYLPQREPSQTMAERYDAAVDVFDASLAPLYERRDQLNLVLLADHGEALGAHQMITHCQWLFEELTHIPLLVRIPGAGPAQVKTLVSSTGVFNLIRSIRGLPSDPSASEGLLEFVDASNPGNGPGVPAFEMNQWALSFGSFRLLYTPRWRLTELYDLSRDPREQRDLSDEEPVFTAQLLDRLFELHNRALP
ncbi:MAG TPA: sulfatase-like hydrolase/transferase, partial [Polyangiaceae bacterium]